MRPIIAESPGEQQVGDWGGGQRGTEARTTLGSRQQPKQEQVCSVEFRCGPGDHKIWTQNETNES